MDTTTFSTMANVIKSRRTVKAFAMNGNKIPNGEIAALLELADWAPTHAFTEPWRFTVYENPAIFCAQHAEIYKQSNTGDEFVESVYNNLLHQGDKASHVVLTIMKRGKIAKVPAFEEISAASCAIQNMLLAATALNIASFWSTGGMALKPAFKEFFQLGEEDQVMGVIYLGYANEYPKGKRIIPIEEKINWIK